MALVIEDGTGVALADSYLSVADADAYHAAYGNIEWTEGELSEEDKEIALRRASRDIDILYGSRYLSKVLTTTQGLLWPRLSYTSALGATVIGLTSSLKAAVAELALIETTTDVFTVSDGAGNIKKKDVKLGDLNTSIEYFSPSATLSVKLSRVLSLLGPIISISSGGRYATVLR